LRLLERYRGQPANVPLTAIEAPQARRGSPGGAPGSCGPRGDPPGAEPYVATEFMNTVRRPYLAASDSGNHPGTTREGAGIGRAVPGRPR
jgi:hypothetical protein